MNTEVSANFPESSSAAPVAAATPRAGAPASSPSPGARPFFDRYTIRAAHADLILRLAAIPAPKIFLEPDPEDFEEIGSYLTEVLERVKEHLAKVACEAGMNGGGNLDDLISGARAALSDVESDFAGTMDKVAARMREDGHG